MNTITDIHTKILGTFDALRDMRNGDIQDIHEIDSLHEYYMTVVSNIIISNNDRINDPEVHKEYINILQYNCIMSKINILETNIMKKSNSVTVSRGRGRKSKIQKHR
jgi:hypothetical protein